MSSPAAGAQLSPDSQAPSLASSASPTPPRPRWRRIARRIGFVAAGVFGAMLLVVVWTTVLGLIRSDPVVLAAAADTTIVRDVTRLTAVRMARIVAPRTTEELSAAVRGSSGPISIGGGRYSMGGQTATPDGIQLDMRRLTGVVSLDTAARMITVRSGTTWREVQEAIDPHNLAVQVMQTYNTFTIGGAISVNAHGRYIGYGPVSSSVRSLRLVLASGQIVTASRTERPDLFWAALGGYGGVAVIAEATLSLAPNVRVRREDEVMPVSTYHAWFQQHVRGDSSVIFHNADITPGEFSDVRAVTYRRTDAPLTTQERLRPKDQSGWVTPSAYALFTTPYGPWLRRNFIEPLAYRVGGRHPVTWRNYEASYDVSELEPPSRVRSTYVLQEFFLPVDSAERFVARMGSILRDSLARTVNVSIRHANAEPSPYLTWAPSETFAFVLYYRQGTSSDEQRRVGRWTRALIDAAIATGGRYYLPYQPHATRAQFLAAYPRATEFFEVKRRVDPAGRFTNVLWDLYAPGGRASAPPNVTALRRPSFVPAEVRLAVDSLPGYNRTEANTWTTHPEWDLVYSSEQYAEWLSSGKRPSAFPYSATVGTFWRSYDQIWKFTRARDDFPGGVHLMLAVIGTSTAFEYGVKSIYEGTIGRLSEWLGPDGLTPEERVAAKVNSDYARFIAIRPWYEFDYVAARRDLFAAAREDAPGWFRRLERRAILAIEFTVKGWYAALIGGGTHAVYAPDEITRWVLAVGPVDSSRVPGLIRRVPLYRGYQALALPRYAGIRDGLVALSADSLLRVVELSGNQHVAITGTAPSDWQPPPGVTPILAYRVPIDSTRIRVIADVVATDLLAILRRERANPRGLRLDHLYDY